MFSIKVDNVNRALPCALALLDNYGTLSASRNGVVYALPEPCSITYAKPWQRVLNSPIRNANPFFHFMESLWMLAGRNDVAFPALFNKRMREYSDNGSTFWGAYGWRWRNHFMGDQVASVIVELNAHPDSRRAVLGMWCSDEDPAHAAKGGKDVPCNTHAYFDLRGGKLNMTVCNRSNDALWGAFGANVVHFSYLQQFIAECLRVPMGWYMQMTNNLHVYNTVLPRSMWNTLSEDVEHTDMYLPGVGDNPSHRLSIDAGRLISQLSRFIDNVNNNATIICADYTEPTIRDIAIPMLGAWKARANIDSAEAFVTNIAAWDWQLACRDWIRLYHERRESKLRTKA